ncbi:MAG: hypothetical protein JEZ09_12865 [Salinivirgaceae bacterium]|nr:hypothetical protein [Salinivirgaceae bacterium]
MKKICFILIGILRSQGILKLQTSEFTDSLVNRLGFYTYLSHVDGECYTYILGNTKDNNFPATEVATSSADFPLTKNALHSDFLVCEKSFNSSFIGRKKSFASVINIKNRKLLNSTYLGLSFIFNIHPDKLGNVSFVAEAVKKSEVGMTGLPISRNAIMKPPTYALEGRLLLNAIPEPKKCKKVVN